MPDFFSVLARRWKWILTVTLLATAGALLACLLTPPKYLSTVTALPSNPVMGDKARIFNDNIEGLYNELGSPDELDKIEGTARLDTLFLAAARQFNLPVHYKINDTGTMALYKAASALQKSSKISRTGYGELQLKVWDKNPVLAAALANALLQYLNDIHLHLRTATSRAVLQRLKQAYAAEPAPGSASDSIATGLPPVKAMSPAVYATLITEYELALKTVPQPLLVVEPARPALKADKPKTLQTVLLVFAASLLFSVLLAFYTEIRKLPG